MQFLDSIKLNTFFENSPKLFEIWQIDQFNINHGKIHIQTENVYSSCDDLQILFAIAHVSPGHNLEQEFLLYELTNFLFLSSRVFLRSCSFDLQYWKPVFSLQEPQTVFYFLPFLRYIYTIFF